EPVPGPDGGGARPVLLRAAAGGVRGAAADLLLPAAATGNRDLRSDSIVFAACGVALAGCSRSLRFPSTNATPQAAYGFSAANTSSISRTAPFSDVTAI